MTIVSIPSEQRQITDVEQIRAFLEPYGIWYRRDDRVDGLGTDATDEQILAAYRQPIERLKAEGGYVTADVINVVPTTPGLEAMLARFSKEHWHSEDEVRFIVGGKGLFHIHPTQGAVFAIEVVKGDMINVPRGTLHWFDLCIERTIRAIRLFQDPAGWTPHYSDARTESQYQPLCFSER